MLDGVMRLMIDPVLNRAGKSLVNRGVTANAVTLAGLGFGLACGCCIAFRYDIAALLLLALGRIADGLDGAVARASQVSDRGAFLDITCDFIFYGAVPLAFALRDPSANAMASVLLLTAFYVNGASFLAFSAIAAKRGMSTEIRGAKSLYYTTGLMEGTETIAFFAAFILFPASYPKLALIFAGFCVLTCIARILLAWRVFGRG
jgi:phosphatidylglycerophosphate synthase